jgi:endoglucanase
VNDIGKVPRRRRQRWSRVVAAVTAALIAGGIVAVTASEASAATVDVSAWYVLVNRNSGKALDVYGADTSDGARITQWTRNDANNQQFQFVDSGGGYYRLRARHSGKVLDVYNWSTADGANIVQWSDSGGVNQQFRLADSPDGYVRLINRNSGKAVEVEGLSTADGARVQQWSDWGGANQQWQLVRIGGAMTAQQVVAAMQPGWNLGNSFDATGSDETSWGNPRVTEALLDNIKAQGFKSIRIPVTWSQHQGGAPNYTIDSAWMSRVREVVDWAIARDLYVLINVHHDSWQWIWNMPSQHDTVLARFNATWTQIATTFRDHSNRLLFESVNEPQFTGSSGDTQEYQLLNELNVNFRSVVRQSGGNNATRVLVLPTLHTDSGQARVNALVNTISQMGDPNVAATFHYYGFWPFSVNIAGYTRFNTESQNDLTAAFDRMYTAFTAHGIPVILGEYGLLAFDRNVAAIEQGEKLKYFEYLGYYARTRQITTMLWDNGQHFGRTSFQWSDPEMFNQIKSSWSGRSGTASDDFIYTARSSSITNRTLTLNLNGASVVAVRQGSTDLAPNTDYTVSGDQLTLTASALTRLYGSRTYGVNANIQLYFSTGVPWRVNIVTYDPPLLSSATGTTSSFAIPTQFRGDRVATMEAKYADGSSAGPNNWTSFKEYDVTFAPDYAANQILLRSAFFAEVNDGSAVTLTIHFWSGTRVTYRVVKNGGTVTGTA